MNRTETDPPEPDIEYRQSNLYRVIHVDGVWGGISPSGLIEMVLFSEHRVPPPDDQLTDAVRELEACILLRPDVAIAMRDWLDQHIEHQRAAPSA